MFGGFPDEGPAFDQTSDRIHVGEGFGIATKDDVHVAQIAIDADAFGSGGHEVFGGKTLLFRTVFRVGGNVDDFLRVALVVDHVIAFRDVGAEFADDFGQVLAGRDHAPATNGVEAYGDRFLRQERRRVFRAYVKRMN